MTQEKLTVEYIRSGSLNLCYTDQEIQDLCDRAHEIGRLAVLLEIPRVDAVWALASLAPRCTLIEVSASGARRAREYAARATHVARTDRDANGYPEARAMLADQAAARASSHAICVSATEATEVLAANAAGYAAAAAGHAANDAYSETEYQVSKNASKYLSASAAAGEAHDAEYQITIRHYCSLMGWE